LNKGEPISVGKSSVWMMSLTPSGMPSSAERCRPARQRSLDASACARALSKSATTKAETFGSHAA